MHRTTKVWEVYKIGGVQENADVRFFAPIYRSDKIQLQREQLQAGSILPYFMMYRKYICDCEIDLNSTQTLNCCTSKVASRHRISHSSQLGLSTWDETTIWNLKSWMQDNLTSENVIAKLFLGNPVVDVTHFKMDFSTKICPGFLGTYP